VTDLVPPDRARSRAVLVGTSQYDELTPVPAAARSLDRMHRLLTGPLCGWPDDRVTVIGEQRLPADLPDQLVDLYIHATDVALFYYVGHGQIDDEGQLCLGLVGSRLQTERRATTSLTFDAVRRALRASSAAVKVVILDCCFAGQAVYGPHVLAGQNVDVTALISTAGAYTLAATGPYSTAWFESETDSPTPHTYFTKYLAELVERGIPGEPAGLTLDAIYHRLREDLPAAGKPVPTRTSRDRADTFLFARNAAPRPAANPPPSAGASPGTDPARRFRLLDDAEDAARTIGEPANQAWALARIAKEASTDDPDRSRRLLDDAERLAHAIDDPKSQASAWTDMAAVVVSDDPDRARKFLDDAERAVSLDVSQDRTRTALILRAIAVTRLAFDPDGAERTARSITDQHHQDWAVRDLVRAAVARDPDLAERLARTIPDPGDRAAVLAGIAATVAAYDPARADRLVKDAERTARSIASSGARAEALRDVVARLMGGDAISTRRLLDQAKRVADTITDTRQQILAWAAIAEAAVVYDPGTADSLLPDRILREITDLANSAGKQQDLVQIVRVMAVLDLGRAEEIAHRLNEGDGRDLVFAEIVRASAALDPDRAERIARNIAFPKWRAKALAIVAGTLAEDNPDNSGWLLENAKRIARAAGLRARSDSATFQEIAQIVATYDPGEAQSIVVDGITGQKDQGRALAAVAKIVAQNDPGGAEHIIETIAHPETRSYALAELAMLHASHGQARAS